MQPSAAESTLLARDTLRGRLLEDQDVNDVIPRCETDQECRGLGTDDEIRTTAIPPMSE